MFPVKVQNFKKFQHGKFADEGIVNIPVLHDQNVEQEKQRNCRDQSGNQAAHDNRVVQVRQKQYGQLKNWVHNPSRPGEVKIAKPN